MNHYNQAYPAQQQGQSQDAMQQQPQGMGQQQAYYPQYPQQPVAYPGYPPQAYAPYYQQQAMAAQQTSFLNERVIKGALIGAVAAYILTNENVQRTAIKSAVKAWSLLQGGVEEMKERFHDAEAEIRAEAGE